MSDSRPTTYAELAKRPTEFREVELLPAAANPFNTIAAAEMMYRRYGAATPVSGKRTAIMQLRHFQRTAQMLMEAADELETEQNLEDAYDAAYCGNCRVHGTGEVVPCNRHA